MDCIICRYGELALKGKNRGFFEKQLVHNIGDCMKKNSIDADIKKIRGRIFVHTTDPGSLSNLKKVFGLTSISPAVISETLPDVIKKDIVDYVNKNIVKEDINTFRITTRRTNKDFSIHSNDMDVLLGDAVNEEFGFKVKLKDPDLNIGVEIHDKTFIFHEKIECFGGLPVGVSGNVACLIEKEQDLVAAWLMLKRGCFIFPVGKKETDIISLNNFAYGQDITLTKINSFSEIEGVAEKNECKALITGDTLESFNPEKYQDAKTTILNPLIAYDDNAVSDILEMIQ